MRFDFRRLRRGPGTIATQKRSAARRVLLVDPELGVIGHHRRYSSALKQAFETRGFDVLVYSARSCPRSFAAQIGARRVFKSSVYGEAEKGVPLPVRWIRANATLTGELAAGLPRPTVDDLILVHTTAGDHLLGYYAWYVGLPEPRPRICLQIMFPPEFATSEADRDLAIEFTGRALRPWLEHGSERALIGVDNHRLGERLRQLYGHAFPVLPMPIWNSSPPPAQFDRPKDRPVLFVPGEMRREKGKSLIKAAANLQNKNFNLFVQSARKQNWHRRSGVHVAPFPPDYRKYLQFMVDTDAVLLPYDPHRYSHRSSAAFVEALGCGKPVLVTAGTSMADELERLGPVGVVMRDYALEGLIEAIRDLVANFNSLSSAAERIAPEIRARHTAPAFAQEIIDWARGDRAAEPRPPEAALVR